MVAPYYEDESVRLLHGDALDVLREMPDASVDAVVTDPPYGLANTDPAHVAETITRWVNGERDYLPGGSGFMGETWDAFVPPVAVWDECLRVLKPGGHVLTFAGSRTVDLMTLGLRLAGFDIRDSIAWLYGSGFPKSLDVSKAIDKAAGHWRGKAGEVQSGNDAMGGPNYERTAKGDPITAEAEAWDGWGTALKPAFEPIVVARKPLARTVAANVLEHGTGALNIDGCRIGTTDTLGRTNNDRDPARAAAFLIGEGRGGRFDRSDAAGGRWPTNVALDDTQAAVLDEQSGESRSGLRAATTTDHTRDDSYTPDRGNGQERGHADSGGASRFFPTFRYEAKAPATERPRVDGVAHPTVKPLDLMRWLVRLVTPPGGTVLEPFAGSGTTVEACVVEGVNCIAIEKAEEYLPLVLSRIHRRRDPVAAIRLAGDDLGLFDLDLGEEETA